MEVKILIIEISPRLPYLKTDIIDSFSISFLYGENVVKIEDLESYLSKPEPAYISISNITQNYIYFYLLKNSKHIMGIGEIPLLNNVKWFNLKEFNKDLIFNNINNEIIKGINIDSLNKEIISLSSSYNNNNNLYQGNYNIKFKICIEIINCNNENLYNNKNIKNSISLKGSADSNSNSNSISNTCSNSKTPKNMKNSLLNKNNMILLKNNNAHFKKIDIYSNNKTTNNSTLFSSINNRLLRNQTEKKITHENKKREKVFSCNDYYDTNLNSNTESCVFSQSKIINKKKDLNFTETKKDKKSNIFKKRNKIITAVEQLSYQNDNINNSNKLLNEIPKNHYFSNKKINNRSCKNITIKNKQITENNLFIGQNNIKEKLKVQKVRNINNNSFKKIEDVIIDQNFKNEIKKDELLGFTSNNTSIMSSFNSTKNNNFYSPINNEYIFTINNDDDISLNNFNNKKNAFFNNYTFEYIKSIDNNLLFLELHCFINKIIILKKEYQKEYINLYHNFLNSKNTLKVFKFLYLNTLKRIFKLKYRTISLSSKDNKNKLISEGIELYETSRNKIIYKKEIPFWNQLLCSNNNKKNNIINNSNRIKIELIRIFLDICQKNENYFNSLSKKCYNDIKNKYMNEQYNKFVKSYDKQYYKPSANNKLNNSSSLSIKKISTKSNFYPENSKKNSKNKYISKNTNKKEGLIIEQNNISSYNNKKSKKKQKSYEKIKHQKK